MGENKKDLEEAQDFTLRYCNPKDNEIISELDRHARESAWALLQRIKHLESKKCVCEECGSEVEEEPIAEESEPSAEGTTSTPTEGKVEKLIDIAESSQDVLKTASKHASKVVVGATVVAAASQTASAATPTVASAVTTFVQETVQKVAAIGTFGVMAIGSGAYFQAKTAKTEGLEIAVVTEQQYGVFSSFNKFTKAAFGVEAFDTIVEYAENGYGDIEGTGPSDGNGGDQIIVEQLSPEERQKRNEENAKLKKEMKDKFGIDIYEPLEEDKPVTKIGGN
jgi:hypothetical protein